MGINAVILVGISGKSPGGDFKIITKEIDGNFFWEFPGRFPVTISRGFLD